HADNGMVGIVNDRPGILQFGTQEIDGYTTDVSEKGLNGNFSAPISGTIYNQSATNNPNWGGDSSKPNKQTGSINYASDSYNGPHMEPAYASTGTYWNGPAAKISIAATSQNTRNNNFTLTMMLHFETTVSELGRMELTLEAGGKVQYQMVVTDNNAVKDEIQVDCYVKDQQVGTMSLDRSKFTNDKLMQARLSKFGSSINFEVSPWNGKSGRELTVSLPPLTRPDMISENVEAFSVWFERNNTWGQAAMKLIAVQFDWQHVNWWTDIKNRFSNGDVLTIDVANAKTYLNGSENRTLHTIGNQWEQFKLPPGDTEIDITPSSWAQPFACEVEIREAWL
ncbi:phage distal tail protein, partial [Lacticaseibacillus paracasei]|uniref:phage distal tail protein n=1 Tax=Lacticaseibacillus paracasei TaxID=1597 RepID=UPI0023626B0A